jgi:PAS domain S-box-containing protein
MDVAGVGSVLAVPLIGAGRTRGVLMFVCREGPEPDRADELAQRLGLLADVLASALARKDSEDALRGSEEMKSAILSSMPTSVAVLDDAGTIVAVNEFWRRWAQDDAAGAREGMLEGRNCLEIWRGRSRDGVAHAEEIAEAIEGVLDGSRASFTGEYQSANADGRRWCALSVVPRVGPTHGAVVSLTDITQRRSAEIEAQNSRHELAHLLRVSTVGVMATSLAHELNQPLTAILANAQAAQRALRESPPDIPELKQILADMIAQDKRAGEVVGRLRELLRKGHTRRVAVSLTTVVRDVAHLLASDAVIRNVSIRLQLDDGAPLVDADGTQIQQVVLNLLLNAMDASADDDHQRRTVTVVVGTGSAPSGPGVQVSVCDTGTGIPAASEERIFEPFFTTKASGMGMGLSIARSIVVSHGGRIAGANNPEGGATFTFVLPARPS